jgi:hypothetical protein
VKKVFWKTKKGFAVKPFAGVKNPSQGFYRKPLMVFHSFEKPFRVFWKTYRSFLENLYF